MRVVNVDGRYKWHNGHSGTPRWKQKLQRMLLWQSGKSICFHRSSIRVTNWTKTCISQPQPHLVNDPIVHSYISANSTEILYHFHLIYVQFDLIISFPVAWDVLSLPCRVPQTFVAVNPCPFPIPHSVHHWATQIKFINISCDSINWMLWMDFNSLCSCCTHFSSFLWKGIFQINQYTVDVNWWDREMVERDVEAKEN